MAYKGYNPDTDMPDLAGKVILLTGGTGGVGKTAVVELAKHNPAHIYFTGRNQAAADALIAECAPSSTNLTFLRCDHGSLDSIRQTAERFVAASTRLDVFIANAGIMAVPAGLTSDGYEVQFGTNHLGNAALLMRLLRTLLRTADQPGADVRLVSVTSLGYAGHPKAGIEFDGLRTKQESIALGTWGRYGQSKLANVLFAHELARRHPRITGVVVHPGVIRTELVNTLGFLNKMLVYVANPRGLLTPRKGCFNTIWAATSGDVKDKVAAAQGKGEKVALFEPVGKVHAGDAACWDEKLARELWEWTAKEVGVEA